MIHGRRYFIIIIFKYTRIIYYCRLLIKTNCINSVLCLLHEFFISSLQINYLVTVSQQNFTTERLDPTNLSWISYPSSSVFTSVLLSIPYYNDTYFVSFQSFIIALLTSDCSVITHIAAQFWYGTRDIVFLNNGDVFCRQSIHFIFQPNWCDFQNSHIC